MGRTLLSIANALFSFAALAQIEMEAVITSGLNSPVDIAHCGDARLFIVERPGTIRILQPDGKLAPQPFLDITDHVHSASSEQGLLGLAFHPQYATNGRFFVYYVTGTGNGTLRLSRFTVSSDPDVAAASSEVVLWSLAKPYSNHNGGDLDFGPDGYLYFAPGDGGDGGDPGNRAQNMAVGFGKVLRIDVNSGSPYGIPPTNPYATSNTVMREIWAAGLRNPWRFGFDRQNGDLWIGDVGQDAQEEIDRWPSANNSGPNFGWRCYEGTQAYNVSGCQPQNTYVAPVFSHMQNQGAWCSVIAGRVYRGSLYPSLQGKFIYSDYCHGRLHALVPDGNGGYTSQQLTSSGNYGIACIAEDVNGELYVVNTESDMLMRIIDPSATVRVSPKVFLEGPFNSSAGLMGDALRTAGTIPLTEPYTTRLGFSHVASQGGEVVAPSVLGGTGNNAIVDWVRVELRSAAHPSVVVASRQGLLQRDGDIVSIDGVSSLTLHVGPGSYHVAVRHRNHLGCMTASPVALSTTTVVVDLRVAATATWGTEARKSIGTHRVLHAGNTMGDGKLSYTGAGNDRDPVLLSIGGVVPTATINGYHESDVNMDNTVRYTGTTNDRDPILVNIGGVVPTAVRTEQLP
ncbi:MAG TPA: PQQ-dependent sugar dehydrogenase [Flavobacteriales bacterium]